MKPSRWFIYGLIAISIAMNCSETEPVCGIEITNGNCVGTIYNADGSAANGAVVRLIPRDFDPFSHADSLIDSTYTDKNGNFAFVVTRTNRYNLIAQKSTASCMDSIDILSNAKVVVKDTLRESGFISGTVRLQKTDTANSIVILVLGTNIFTTPSDTSGKFETPLLAAGTYMLRLFSTQSGYAVFDTLVNVLSGSETKLPVIFLPSANAPTVEKFSAALDSLTMYTSLTWSLKDTDKIVSYSLYRKSKNGNDTMIMIDKSSISFTDDVILCDGDTLTYEIAAIGKNYKEGFRSNQQTIIPQPAVRCIKKITPEYDVFANFGADWLYFDQSGSVFIGNNVFIQKLDSNGAAKESYKDRALDSYGDQRPQGDDFGNLYWKKCNGAKDTTSIIRFDANLNVLGELILTGSTSVEISTRIKIAVTGDGKLLVIRDSIGELNNNATSDKFTRHITIYDSNFVQKDDYYIQNIHPIIDVTRVANIFIAEQWFFKGEQQYSVGFYDQSFNSLSTIDNFDFLKKYKPAFLPWIGSPLGGPQGLVFACAYDGFGEPVLLILESNKQLLARVLLPVSLSRIFFDHSGNFYCLQEVDDNQKTGYTIYKYSMLSLLSAGTY